jgi:carbon-monoxide dehydrogenase small subunit
MGPLQEAMWEEHSFQCGFCTPGMLVQLSHLLQTNPTPNETEVRDSISGNLCRCTGYESIVRGAMAAAKRLSDAD